MIYSVIVWLLWLIETIILGSLATVAGLFDRTGRVAHHIARLWGRAFIISSGIKVNIIGAENIVKDGPQIFISNHQGYFDIFSYTAYFPVQLRWIAKKELFKIPFVGWAMRAARYVSINRQVKKSAIRSIQEAVRLLNDGFSVVIFPEGTRSYDGKMLPFKRGSLIMINKTDAPVVPVTISGSYNIIRKKSLKIHRGEINIMIDEPIYTSSMDKEEKGALLEKIRAKIEGNLRELTGGNYEA
jgi:1-acyl-sn-glycerol-3-phosphate acyltransferase